MVADAHRELGQTKVDPETTRVELLEQKVELNASVCADMALAVEPALEAV